MHNQMSIGAGVFLLLALSAPVWGQSLKIVRPKVKVPTPKIQTRIKGANISQYSMASQGWAQTYKLNQNFLNSLEATRLAPSAVKINLPPRMKAHLKGLSAESTGIITKHLEVKLAWIQKQPNQGKDLLKEIDDLEINYRFYQKLDETDLVFVGEIHGNLPPRVEFANLIKEFKTLYSNRKVVVFAEAAYLKPIEGESVFPYQYYRRGTEGVEPPIDFAEKTNPNARLMADETLKFNEMFSTLSNAGVEIYPVEDAVIAQKESAQGTISTVNGLAERNKGFARTMQAQMDKIRLEHPDALFIYYGGMAHTSWAMPASLPKFFAQEKPLVVELIAEKDVSATFSVLPAVWQEGHPAFTQTGAKRLFLWNGNAAQATAWGQTSGFDCRLIIP